jgi:hypothetical protein
MATEVSICSNALLMLGDKPIASFDDVADRARIAANLWPDIRDDVLRSKIWLCAKKRVQLAPDATAPVFGYGSRFLKPADWLRTVQVGIDYSNTPYADEDGYILCDTNPLPLVYVYRNTNPAKWDSMLVRVMTLACAAQFAYPITRSPSVEKNRFDQLADAWRRAGAVSSQDDGPEDIGAFDLVSARFISRSQSL